MTQLTYQTQETTLDNQMYTIVQAYDLAAAVKAVQDYVQRGYEVCFSKNETYPISIGTMISFGVAKPIVESDKPSVVPEQQEAKPARKAKGTPLA
jgi:hypothetical protein